MEHLKASDIILRTSEDPSLVQFEENFNTHTEILDRDRDRDRLSQTRPIPRSPDGDKKSVCAFPILSYCHKSI